MITQNASFTSLALHFKDTPFFFMAQISVYPLLTSVSSQDCLTVVINFKHHGFDILLVHQVYVRVLVDPSGTPLQARPEQGLGIPGGIDCGPGGSQPQLVPVPRGHQCQSST